ncbi:MAG: hypothetical protein QOH29_2533, partial [Actinomycetota bacterium]|nr:hypothetical protein [Actinomycetota bacterium]
IDTSSLPVAAAIDAATVDLEFSFAAGTSGEACRSLTGEARRIRLELLSLASARSVALQDPIADAALLASLGPLGSTVSQFLTLVADGLARADVHQQLDEALAAAEQAIDDVRRAAVAAAVAAPDAGHDGSDARLTSLRANAAAAALGGQLRAVAALVPDAVDVRRPPRSAAIRSAGRISRRGARGAEAIVERMRANLTWRSDAFQHALRLACVVSASAVVAHAVGIGRGYWLALTAVLVLRPEFSVTFTRGLGRALGTLLGVGIASVVAVTTHPHGWVLVAFVGVFVWLSGALFNVSYAVFSVAVTGVVVFLLAGLDADPVGNAGSRLLATVLGAALALGAYAIWPAWGRRRVADAVADLADATRRYVDLVLRALSDGSFDAAAISNAGRAVRLARTNAESAIERSLGDPTSRQVDRGQTMELLAAFRRLAIASHTLRFPSGVGRTPTALRDLHDALDAELTAIAARLRFGRMTLVRQPLRERHRALVESLAGRGDDDGRLADDVAGLIIAETDEMVDATNSLADLLDRPSQP